VVLPIGRLEWLMLGGKLTLTFCRFISILVFKHHGVRSPNTDLKIDAIQASIEICRAGISVFALWPFPELVKGLSLIGILGC